MAEVVVANVDGGTHDFSSGRLDSGTTHQPARSPLYCAVGSAGVHLHDFASGLLLIAIFGAWWLLAAAASARVRRVVVGSYAVLAAATILAGVLLGFTGYFDHFKRNNSDLYYAFQDHLSLCRRP